MGTQALSKPIPIQDFVAELRKFPEPAFTPDRPDHSFSAEHAGCIRTLTPYLTWDRQHYTRNLIDKTPLYELVAICWEVGQASSVHNHREQNCWMAVPIGRLRVENYRTIAQNLEAGHLRARNRRHRRNESAPALRRGSAGARASGL